MSVTQLSRILPLPEADLQQLLDYASTISKKDAAEHFKTLLGETPQSIEFISTFNSRRQDPSSTSEVPKPIRKPPKKKAPLHTPPPRQVQDSHAAQGHAYTKKDEEDYINKKPTNNSAFQTKTPPPQASAPRLPPSAAGLLISDIKPVSKSAPTSRTASPGPKTKINITGGTLMQAPTSISALDSAIRSLEIQTNPTNKNAARNCDCMATRHPLLTAAPNCLSCGKIICVKEGLGPCTFCGTPLLSQREIQAMIRSLKEDRGKEKMALDASSHRRADISKTPAPFSAPRSGGPTPGEAVLGLSVAEISMRKAQEHRDRLLGFQSQNAKRTTVHDEAADFDTPDAGTNMWSNPVERARQLKQQQKVLREMEWHARPEYEKRKQVLSLDIAGGKVVKRIGLVAKTREEPQRQSNEEDGDQGVLGDIVDGGRGKGTFSRNPLLGNLIRPVWSAGKGKGVDTSSRVGAEERRKKTWRRVQDDEEDNEGIILDGGLYGGDASGSHPDRRLGVEEHSFSY